MAGNEVTIKIGAETSGVKAGLTEARNAVQDIGPVLQQMSEQFAEVRNSTAQSAEGIGAALQGVDAGTREVKKGAADLALQTLDVGKQFAAGAAPMDIFSEHAAGVFSAISEVTGISEGFIGFMGGPWGAVIVGAVGLLGSLWKAHAEAAQAEGEHGSAVKSLAETLSELDRATGQLQKTTDEAARDGENAMEDLLAQQAKARQETVEKLKQATDTLNAAQQTLSTNLEDAGAAAIMQLFETYRIEKFKNKIDEANDSLFLIKQNMIGAKEAEGMRQVDDEFDKSAAAAHRFENAVAALNTRFKVAGGSMAEYLAAYRDLKQQEVDELGGVAKSKTQSVLAVQSAPKIDVVAQLDEQLNAKKVAWQKEQDAHGTAIEFDKRIEIAYWKAILDNDDLNSNERSAITQKYLAVHSAQTKEQILVEIDGYKTRIDAVKDDADQRLQIATEEAAFIKTKFGEKSKEYAAAEDQIVKIKQETADQKRQIESDLAKTNQQLRDIELSDEQRNAEFRVKMGQETAAQLIVDEKLIAVARRDAAIASVDQQIQTTPKNELTKLQQLADQKKLINQKYQSDVTALDQKAELERTQIGRTAITSFANTWAQSLSKLVTLQAGFSATLKSLYQGLGNVISGALASIIEKWLVKKITAFAVEKGLMSASTAASLAGETAKTTAAAAGAASRTATDIAAATVSKAVAVAQISTLAGIAGAGGTASMAAAPFPLDMGAPAFGASMAASAMGFSSMVAVPGFDVGAWNLSKDQLAMVHSGEMIIPADVAAPMRAGLIGQTSNNNNLVTPNRKADGDTHLHFTFNGPTDKASIAKWMMDNKHGVAAAGKAAYRSNTALPR